MLPITKTEGLSAYISCSKTYTAQIRCLFVGIMLISFHIDGVIMVFYTSLDDTVSST